MTTTTQAEQDVQVVTYGPPQLSDRNAIVAMLKKAYQPFPGWSDVCSRFDEPDQSARLDFNIERQMGVVARLNDELVGIAGWRLRRSQLATGTPNSVELVVLHVLPQFRRQGIGEGLCRAYLEQCARRNFGDPIFNLPTDAPVEGLMTKLGYSERSRTFRPGSD